MQHKNTKELLNKTIKSVTKGATNCWNLNFTDGSSVSIWAELDGPLGLGQLWLDEKADFKRKSLTSIA